MSTFEVKIPDLGGHDNVPVIEVLVSEGEAVEAEQPLIVLESDKATMEVPAPKAGTVGKLTVKVGDNVSAGSVICTLELTPATATEKPAPSAEKPAAPSAPPAAAPEKPAAAQAAAAAAAAATQTLDVRIPDIGGHDNVPVIEILVADGDVVAQDQPLLVMESDKATMEMPAPAAGTVQGFALKIGSTVSQGDLVCQLIKAASAPAPAATAPTAPTAAESATTLPGPSATRSVLESDTAPQAPITTARPETPPYAGPATRQFARKLGVDLVQVSGSGARGRIVIEDVQAFVKQRLQQPAAVIANAPMLGGGIPPIPAVDFSAFGTVNEKPLARIRKLSAAHLSRAWLNIPHVTQTDDADITELEAFRQDHNRALGKDGNKLTLLAFMVKAVASALKAYPEFNSSLSADGGSLLMKQYCNIGFAADTPNGLVVPVVRDVWRKGLRDIAADCAQLAQKARDGKLSADDMRGGCFSISSLGGIGGGYFTPIVNAPEVGILGVSKAVMKPVWDGQAFVPRLMCPLSLSYDHRVIDGAYAARFMVHLGELLADLRRLLL